MGTLTAPRAISFVTTDEQQALAGERPIPSRPAATESTVKFRKKEVHAICSQQLVHFDRSGKPLWWNGWLATRKIDDKTEIEFRDFTVYAKETKRRRKRGAPDPYSVKPANIVCMQTEEYSPFSSQELEVLEMLRSHARDAIAPLQ